MHEDLIKALRNCETHATCRDCTYRPKDDDDMRCNNLLTEAADVIEEQQKLLDDASEYNDVLCKTVNDLNKELEKWKEKYKECFRVSMELFVENQNLQDVFRPWHEYEASKEKEQ